jgi:serine/threonine protein kinase
MSNDTSPLDKLSGLHPAAYDPPPSCLSVVAHEEDLPRTIGKYEVLGRLGVGAMGVVYKCRQPDLDRPVAVKVLLAARHAPGQVLRFRREAWAAARLQHPNVVQIYEAGNEGELPFLVMEYVEGCSLDRLIGTPILTLETTLRLVYQVARALQAAHDQGIIHRDIKPSNILIHTSGHPKLADFGLAKSLHDGQALSGSGDMIGTPRYMSPEQVLAAPDEVDARTDVYSLGAVMYEMLTGRPPVDGPNVLAVLSALIDQEPVPPRQLNAAVPEEVEALCRQALAKDPRQRLPSAGQLADTIQAYLLARLLRQPEPGGAAALSEWFTLPLAVPSPRPGRGRRWGRGRLLAALATVVCGLATVFALVGPPAAPTDADLPRIRADLLARAAAPSEDPPRERANE